MKKIASAILVFVFLLANTSALLAWDPYINMKPGDAVIGKEKGKGARYLLAFLYPKKSGTLKFELYDTKGKLVHSWDMFVASSSVLPIEENMESYVTASGVYMLVINGCGYDKEILRVPFTI